MTKVYDKIKLKKIHKMIKYNPEEAKIQLENYIEDFPFYYPAYTYYTYVLIILNKSYEALKTINYLKRLVLIDSKFNSNQQNVEYINKKIIINKYRILAQLGEYKELYDYYNKTSFFTDDKFSIIPFACEIKLGISKLPRYKLSYYYSQIMRYEENDFYKHMQKHLADYNTASEKQSISLFSANFPLEKIVEEVKIKIPSDNKLCTDLFNDTYIFKYNDCGRFNDKITDYFSVICLHDTNHIITMFPCEEMDLCPHDDLNYLNKSKVKMISQIEKFNRRYQKKSN